MYDIEKSIGFLLAKAHQRGWALFSEEISRFDLTPPQFSVLAFLWQQDGLTQTELSEKTQIDRTTIGGLLDRMARSNLLERRPHPQDRRAHLVYLTEHAWSLEPELTCLAHEVLDRFTAGLSESDKQQLRQMLETLRGERKTYATTAA
ncbi:transcriptional regulator, MarR family [Trichlorobacter thiogenes]|uniref:Transcriptional regulator, MarR family n=1 Tax=Trichlorobacter thiogenes TaxID=115783 RepID=A0A1T4RNK1_9BACT|nr:MarR family transcriptional regulator [Trichlorobacter thiogenes]SKA17376.1 transcriptional regulator, MarR family [Trichlorobacter thiogenes]